MKYSLRILLLLVMIVAITLASREAIHQYHWHRTLPINYFFAAECEDCPVELKVVFDSRVVENVRADAAKQRMALANEIFGDYRDQAQSFGHPNFIHHWPNQYEYQRTYSYSVRELVKERIRAMFFRLAKKNFASMSDEEYRACANSLFAWLIHEDLQAVSLVASWLDDEELSVERKLPLLNRCLAYTKNSECLERLGPCVEQYIDQPGYGRACAELAMRLKMPGVEEAIERRILELKEHWNTELDDGEFSRFEDQLSECVSMIQEVCYYQDDARSLELVESVRTLVASYYSKLATTNWDEWGGELYNEVNWKFEFALANFQNGDFSSDAARFAYRINSLDCFLLVANSEHVEEVEYILKHRIALISPGNPAPRESDHSYESVSAMELREILADSEVSVEEKSSYQERWDKFEAALPHSLSGHEAGSDMISLVRAISGMEPGFAKRHMLELMGNGIPQAFSFAGHVFGGTADHDAIRLIKEKLLQVRNGKEDYSGQEFDLEDVLWQISPAAGYQSGFSNDEFELASKVGSIDELKKLLTQFEYEVLDEVDLEEEGKLFLQNRSEAMAKCIRDVFAHNKRRSLVRDFSNFRSDQNQFIKRIVSRGDDQTHILELFESVALASNGEVNPNVRCQLTDSKKRVSVDVELNGIVYQFGIPNLPENDFRGKVVCDLLNHILMRQNIEERFVSAGVQIFYAKPKLLKQLKERFDFPFEPGAEHYWKAAE